MTSIHEFQCDQCKKKVKAYHNGEHWLPPNDWNELFNAKNVTTTGKHLCVKCSPGYRKPKTK